MRKSGLITLLVILAIFIALGFIFTDRWLESELEDLGTGMVGAKVEIDNLDFSFIGPHLSWQRLQVTNPRNTMTNMIETGFTEFKMEFWPLLRGKVIIENVQMDSIRSGTVRETDGAIPKKEKEAKESSEDKVFKDTKSNLQKEVENQPVFRLAGSIKNVNVDSIISILKLKSPARIDSAKNLLQDNYNKWEQKLSSADPEKDVNRIKRQITSIDVSKIKSVETFNSAVSSAKKVENSIDSLTTSIKQTKKDFNADYSGSTNVLGQLDDWIKQDFSNAMSLAKLPDFSTQNIAKMLFGAEVVNQVNEYLGYIGTARTQLNKISSKNKKEPSPPRLKGQDIYFPSNYGRPNFWLKKIAVSGRLQHDLPLAGQVTDITSNPKMIGKPVEINIAGKSGAKRSFGLQGSLNYLDSIPKENFSLNYNGFAIDEMKLSKSDYFPQAIKKGSGNVTASLNIAGQVFDGSIKFVSNQVQFDFGDTKPSGKLQSIIRDVFNQTTDVTFTAVIKGKKDNLVFALKSNLDEKLASAFKSTASKEIEEAKAKIRKKIEDQVAQKKAQVEKLIAENKEKLEAQIAKYEKKIDEQKELLEKRKKEIEDQKKKYEDQLKDKAKDKLKKLFP